MPLDSWQRKHMQNMPIYALFWMLLLLLLARLLPGSHQVRLLSDA
jgi:hypothetical protein